MQAIKPFAEIMNPDIDVLKKIELVGRTCYKSTDKITDDSAEKFVSSLIKRGHEAMLEHASFCFEIDFGLYSYIRSCIKLLSDWHGFNSYIRFTDEKRILMSGNVRAWRDFFRHVKKLRGIPSCFKQFIRENSILFPEFNDEVFDEVHDDPIYPVNRLETELEFLTHCDMTVRFVVDRGISHEIVRHRPASFAQESTRYCNYGKDKFGNQITFIIPEFFKYGSEEWYMWKNAMEDCEYMYLDMISRGVTPEKARTVLPNSLKTELIMTTNCVEWKHFFELRACNKTGKAHPQMLEVSRPLLDEFKEILPVVFGDLAYE